MGSSVDPVDNSTVFSVDPVDNNTVFSVDPVDNSTVFTHLNNLFSRSSFEETHFYHLAMHNFM
jgi:hypothetical protein